MDDTRGVLDSLSFRLGLVGAQVTQAFAGRVEEVGVGHKHVGTLSVIAARGTCSQREIADSLGVAPSLVVGLIDRLIEMEAVTRTRDGDDRRVHQVALTETGRAVLEECVQRVHALDAGLLSLIGGAAHESLAAGIAAFVGDDGMPTRIRNEL
ncbi:MarR family winged helix-turn-helix transcriptional regulator [Gordonia sp. DT30]|uniref:MarR family winged helix-turn-helix transcriptional regulator n=1 Tax=Gordonia sp. DT30 TaxID=3416546 RepID=UPI003CF7C1DB